MFCVCVEVFLAFPWVFYMAFLGFLLCLGRDFVSIFLVFGFILVFAGGLLRIFPGFSTRFSLVFPGVFVGFS